MDIGFYLLDILPNVPAQNNILTTLNDLCKLCPYDNIVLFNDQYNRVNMNNKYYTLHIQQAKYFDGILFVFDTKSAMLTQTFPVPKKQILYMPEVEWNKNPSLPYGFWYNMYMKDNMEIITDSIDTYELCNICWKKPLSLIKQIDSKEIKNVIDKVQTTI
jgi:hypothetical protein